MSSSTIESNHSVHKNVDTDIHMISFGSDKCFGLVELTKVGWREAQCWPEKRKPQGPSSAPVMQILSIASIYLANDSFLSFLFNQSDVPCLKSKTGHYNYFMY
jgi:hypothetical protein